MRREKGFALIDAMIAVFVVAVGLTAALDMISSMQIEMDMFRKYMMMGTLAQSKLEEYDAASGLPAATGSGDFGTEMGVSTYGGFTYTMSSTDVTSAGLSAAPYNLAGKSKKINVTVTVKDLRNKQHSIILTSIKTIRGG